MIVETEKNEIRIISGLKRKFILCVCGECNKEFYAREDHLRRKKNPIKTCGCGRKKKTGRMAYNAKPKGMAAAKCVFNSYLGRAKKKGWSFDLTFDQFVAETSKNCFYCNSEPKQAYFDILKKGVRAGQKKVNGLYLYNGLDRINSSKGYALDNVRPCCRFCNSAKSDRNEQEFIKWINTLIEFRSKMKCE